MLHGLCDQCTTLDLCHIPPPQWLSASAADPIVRRLENSGA
jgi:hypothetical protein